MGSSLSTEQFEEPSQSMSVEPQSLQAPNKLKNPLAYILTEILTKKAKLDEDLVKENNAILKNFLDTFISEMKKCDKTFELLFKEIYYTGSYYSDLRVSSPDEYDLNLKLKLPFKSVTEILNNRNANIDKINEQVETIQKSPQGQHFNCENIERENRGCNNIIPEVGEILDYHQMSSKQCNRKKRNRNYTRCRRKKFPKQSEVSENTQESSYKNSQSFKCENKVRENKMNNKTVPIAEETLNSYQMSLNQFNLKKQFQKYIRYQKKELHKQYSNVQKFPESNNKTSQRQNLKSKDAVVENRIEASEIFNFQQMSSSQNRKKRNQGYARYRKNKSSEHDSNDGIIQESSYQNPHNFEYENTVNNNVTPKAEKMMYSQQMSSNQCNPRKRNHRWKKKKFGNQDTNDGKFEELSYQNLEKLYENTVNNKTSCEEEIQKRNSINGKIGASSYKNSQSQRWNCDIQKSNWEKIKHARKSKKRKNNKNVIKPDYLLIGEKINDLKLSNETSKEKTVESDSQNERFYEETEKVYVEFNPQVPSYVKYRTTDEGSISNYGLTRFFEDGHLMPRKVQTWLQGVVAKARITYTYPSGVIDMRNSQGGPAATLILKTRKGQIDIDLVPVVECSVNVKPPGIHGNVYDRVKNNLQCFLVPKPYLPSKQAPVNEKERFRLWRTHYPKAEADIIHNIGCAKSVIKLLKKFEFFTEHPAVQQILTIQQTNLRLKYVKCDCIKHNCYIKSGDFQNQALTKTLEKLLRDKENWKILASYYLKTVVMWMIFYNSNPDYWKQNLLGERFLEALKKLQVYVSERKIPYFFSSRYNLLEKMTEAQASPIYNRLHYIIREVERDNKRLYDFFGCPPTFSL